MRYLLLLLFAILPVQAQPLTDPEQQAQEAARKEWEPTKDIEGLRMLLKASPDAAGYVRLSVLLYQNKDLDGSLQAARKAIELDPRCWGAYHNVSVALAAMGKMEEAEAPARKLVELLPKSSKALLELAQVLHAKKEYAEAFTLTTQALSIDPKDEECRRLQQALKAKIRPTKPAFIHVQSPAQPAARQVPWQNAPSSQPAGASSAPSSGSTYRHRELDQTRTASDRVYITNTGKKHHGAGCRHLDASQRSVARSEAEAAGYSACKHCGGG